MPRRGIVHVIGPEQGLTLPGMTIVCGDSHPRRTARSGRAGLRHRHLRGRACARHADADREAGQEHARVAVEGSLPLGVTAKDVILAIIGKLGTAGGAGFVIEYAGRAIRELSNTPN